jgi:hypothetical protein
MKKFGFPLQAILPASLVFLVFLACGGDDGGGPLPQISLPVATGINGLVSITSTNVRPGSQPETAYPVEAIIRAYVFDDPINSNPAAETWITYDGTYSLTVNTLPNTVLYLYLDNQGVTTRLEPVFVAGGSLRHDISLTRRVVTVTGSTAGYTENNAAETVQQVQIRDPEGRTRGSWWSSPGAGAATYAIDLEVPPETAAYGIFVRSPSVYVDSRFYTKVGEVEVPHDAGHDITRDISYNREITAISGTITYKKNSADTPFTGIVYVLTSADPDPDDFFGTVIGFYSPRSSGSTPTPYTVKITRPKAAVTVYLYLDTNDDFGNRVYLDKVEVGANVPTVSKDITCNAETTAIGGNLAYKENGKAAEFLSSWWTPLSVVDGDGKRLGKVTVSGPAGSYTYTASIPRPKAAVTVYIAYNDKVQSAGIPITANAPSKTQDVEISRSVSVIRGKIGGAGKSAINTYNPILGIFTSPYPGLVTDSDLYNDWQESRIGEAVITVPVGFEPYAYEGRIARLGANTHVYYYVLNSSSDYYNIGEADLAAGEDTYTKDFIIGLANKKIVPGF